MAKKVSQHPAEDGDESITMTVRLTSWLKSRATKEAQSQGITLNRMINDVLMAQIYQESAVTTPLAVLRGLEHAYHPDAPKDERERALREMRAAAIDLLAAIDVEADQ